MIDGIPNLLKKAPKAIAYSLIGLGVNKLYDFLFPAPTWGIYAEGTTDTAVTVSSVVEIDISGESIVSDYILESASFASYNKVIRPNFFGIRVTRDGFEASRTEFLSWLNSNIGKTSTFDIICPDYAWLKASLVGYRIIRNASSGAAMVTADLMFQQIREAPLQYLNPTIPKPENQESEPVARSNPVETRTITSFPI